MGNLPPSAITRPLPPPRSHLDEEGEIVMEMERVGGVNDCRRRPYYFRRCKRMRSTNLECLSDDLLFQILVQLPPQDIYDSAMLIICWRWYRIIRTHRFIYANLHCSTPGLIIQNIHDYRHPAFVSMRQGRIQISKFSYDFRFKIHTGWDGLILGFEGREPSSNYILNPTTKQHFQLPLFHCRIPERDKMGITYCASSMEYKVVLAYSDGHLTKDGYRTEVQLFILTIGVDKSWRPMKTQHLSPEARKLFLFSPLVTQGFIHWANTSYHVVTLNVETESFAETPVPLPRRVVGGAEEKMRYTFFYMSSEKYLSLFVACGGFSWDVWEMKPETGEWTKLYNLDLEARNCEFQQLGYYENVKSLVPAHWLSYGEALFFGFSGTEVDFSSRQTHSFTLFNLETREIQSINLPHISPISGFIFHRNSLVWMTGRS